MQQICQLFQYFGAARKAVYSGSEAHARNAELKFWRFLRWLRCTNANSPDPHIENMVLATKVDERPDAGHISENSESFVQRSVRSFSGEVSSFIAARFSLKSTKMSFILT